VAVNRLEFKLQLARALLRQNAAHQLCMAIGQLSARAKKCGQNDTPRSDLLPQFFLPASRESPGEVSLHTLPARRSSPLAVMPRLLADERAFDKSDRQLAALCFRVLTVASSSSLPPGPTSLRTWAQRSREIQVTPDLATQAICVPTMHIGCIAMNSVQIELLQATSR
jgi:hypothetical protein